MALSARFTVRTPHSISPDPSDKQLSIQRSAALYEDFGGSLSSVQMNEKNHSEESKKFWGHKWEEATFSGSFTDQHRENDVLSEGRANNTSTYANSKENEAWSWDDQEIETEMGDRDFVTDLFPELEVLNFEVPGLEFFSTAERPSGESLAQLQELHDIKSELFSWSDWEVVELENNQSNRTQSSAVVSSLALNNVEGERISDTDRGFETIQMGVSEDSFTIPRFDSYSNGVEGGHQFPLQFLNSAPAHVGYEIAMQGLNHEGGALRETHLLDTYTQYPGQYNTMSNWTYPQNACFSGSDCSTCYSPNLWARSLSTDSGYSRGSEAASSPESEYANDWQHWQTGPIPPRSKGTETIGSSHDGDIPPTDAYSPYLDSWPYQAAGKGSNGQLFMVSPNEAINASARCSFVDFSSLPSTSWHSYPSRQLVGYSYSIFDPSDKHPKISALPVEEESQDASGKQIFHIWDFRQTTLENEIQSSSLSDTKTLETAGSSNNDIFPAVGFAVKRSGSVLSEDDDETVASPRNRNDHLLLTLRDQGISYKDIKRQLECVEAESTLRGRYRALKKPKSQRLRKPVWQPKDIRLLIQCVTTSIMNSAKGSNGPRFYKPQGARWKRISEQIKAEGGSYIFGPGTCKKKYDALVAEGIAPGFDFLEREREFRQRMEPVRGENSNGSAEIVRHNAVKEGRVGKIRRESRRVTSG